MSLRSWFKKSTLSPIQVNASKVCIVVVILSAALTYVTLSILDAFAINADAATLTPFQAFAVFCLTLIIMSVMAMVLLAAAMEITHHNGNQRRLDAVLPVSPSSPLFAIISHQLRSPLSAIRWLAEVLKSEAKDSLTEHQISYLDDITEEAKRTVRLINTLLDIARLESGRMPMRRATTNIEALIARVVREMRAQMTKTHVQIVVRKPRTELTPLDTDADLLYQVFANVISNAMRYSKPGRAIVEVSMDSAPNGSLVVSVKDQGIGIPKESQPHIFEKFYRAPNAIKTQTDGTGLGLYIAKLIVDQLGGAIWFTSQENQGSTFLIQIGSAPSKNKYE